MSEEIVSKKSVDVEIQDKRIDLLEDRIEKELKSSNNNLLMVFGIFASMIAFLSFEVQILKQVCDGQALLGLSLIMAGVLLLFLCLLYWVATSWIGEGSRPNKSFGISLVVVILIVLCTGSILLLTTQPVRSCHENQIWLRYSEDFDERQVETENKIEQQISREVDEAIQRRIELLTGP